MWIDRNMAITLYFVIVFLLVINSVGQVTYGRKDNVRATRLTNPMQETVSDYSSDSGSVSDPDRDSIFDSNHNSDSEFEIETEDEDEYEYDYDSDSGSEYDPTPLARPFHLCSIFFCDEDTLPCPGHCRCTGIFLKEGDLVSPCGPKNEPVPEPLIYI